MGVAQGWVGVVSAGVLLVMVGCTQESTSSPTDEPAPSTERSTEPSPSPTTPASPDPTQDATEPPAEEPPADEPPAERAAFDRDRVMEVVRFLAGEIGPREGSSAAFRRAARYVERRFTALGYDGARQPVPVPAGNSWGIDVPAGTSYNVIADPRGFDPREPHIIVGAHLDTVPQAPGAEDNASGVGSVLELARLASLEQPEVPVRFIAFGAEEPRGEGDALHHFGSQLYVREMGRAQQQVLVAMVSLDRVGIRGPDVPLCSAPGGATDTRDAVARTARQLDIEVDLCDDNTTSDHWSFTKAGLPSARFGSIPYDGYHSAGDVPSVIDETQIQRVGRIMWRWLSTRRS